MMVIRKCSRYTYIHTIPCVQKQQYKKEIKKMAEWKLAFLLIIQSWNSQCENKPKKTARLIQIWIANHHSIV